MTSVGKRRCSKRVGEPLDPIVAIDGCIGPKISKESRTMFDKYRFVYPSSRYLPQYSLPFQQQAVHVEMARLAEGSAYVELFAAFKKLPICLEIFGVRNFPIKRSLADVWEEDDAGYSHIKKKRRFSTENYKNCDISEHPLKTKISAEDERAREEMVNQFAGNQATKTGQTKVPSDPKAASDTKATSDPKPKADTQGTRDPRRVRYIIISSEEPLEKLCRCLLPVCFDLKELSSIVDDFLKKHRVVSSQQNSDINLTDNGAKKRNTSSTESVQLTSSLEPIQKKSSMIPKTVIRINTKAMSRLTQAERMALRIKKFG